MAGKLSFAEKLTISLLSAVLFVIIGSPMFYKLVNSFTIKAGIITVGSDGCPTLEGLAVHGVVFFLVVLLVMLV